MKYITVAEFIEELKKFPDDMEIVCVHDYITSPRLSVEKHCIGISKENDEPIIVQRVEIY